VFAQAREKARAISCLSNTKQLGLGVALYAEDYDEDLPTVAMNMMGMAIVPSWVVTVQPYVKNQQIARCPSDNSTNWNDPMSPRAASYGFNAYFDPFHPPYGNMMSPQPFNLAGIAQSSECVYAAELAETNSVTGAPISDDDIQPMYWGNPSRVMVSMGSNTQWDPMAQLPATVALLRHMGAPNYVFADGHAKALHFSATWQQTVGNPPTVDWYDPEKQQQ
jgi:prepilin-type processing-associated H-X9-DG protein